MTLTAKRIQNAQTQASKAGFEALFQENWSGVYRLLLRLVGDHAEAEDLALEAFLRLHQNLGRLSSGGDMSAWLYRVAINLGLNALRGQARREHYETEAGQQIQAQTPPSDPAQEVERRAERAQVRAVLREMKPRSAQLLVLRNAGLSYAEVAAAVGIARGSVGTMLVRAEREFEAIYRKSGRS